MIESFLGWLGGTRGSIALIESLYVWSYLESIHVLTIGLFVGTTLMMDVRLLGLWFKSVPVSEFTGKLLPWTRGGFYVLVATGLLIFYSNPLRYYHNIFFRFKLIVLALAMLNVWLFHSRTHTRISEWELDPAPPLAARVAGAVSIFSWACVVVAGRMIAYNWFDCDLQPQPDFVNWAAGCVLEASGD